jgi:hypothetical protein
MLQDPITTIGSPLRNGPSEAPHTAIKKAIILAAGVGDRLQPFTRQFPKCLVPVNGVPILVSNAPRDAVS